MKRKVRKYVEGGYGDVSSEDYGMGSREEMIERNIEENERRRQVAESPKPPTSVAEFEEPGTAGFSRTALKSAAKPAVKPSPKPATQPSGQTAKPMGRTAMGKTAEQEMAAIEAGKKAAGKADLERRMAYDKPLERVTPESNLIGGIPLRGAKALATGAKEFASYAKQKMGKGAATGATKQLGQSGSKAENLTKDMGPVQYAGKRSMLQNQRGEGVITPPAAPFAERNKRMLLQNQRGEGVITPPAKPFPERNKRRLLSKDSRGEDVIESRKSGGKVGSASRRADGIATRGKTRGRYI